MSDTSSDPTSAPHRLTNRVRTHKHAADTLETVLWQVAENLKQASDAADAEAEAEAVAVPKIIDTLFTMVSDAAGEAVSYGPAPEEEDSMYKGLVADGRFDIKILRFPKSGTVRFVLQLKESV